MNTTGESSTPLVIEPTRGLRFVDLGELWRYRELAYFLTWRNVKVRYKQTAIGVAWAVLQPLAMMVVFTLFFGHRSWRLRRVSHANPRSWCGSLRCSPTQT